MFKVVILITVLMITAEASCPAGFKGDDCQERDCPIGSYDSGKGFSGKFFIDNEGLGNTGEMSDLALKCKVKVKVTKSFQRLTNPSDNVDENEIDLYVGRGIRFDLLDLDDNLLCDKKCLATKPIANSPVDCFLKKLGKHHSTSTPGVLRAKAFSSQSKADMKLLKARQVGCELRDDLPQVSESKLVGSWRLVDSENWEEFLEANNVGYFTRVVVKSLKPDVFIANSGKDWTIGVRSTFKNLDTKFTEGVKWESKTPINGDRSIHLAYSEGKDRLIEDQEIMTNPRRKVHIVREINEKGQLVQTMTIKNIVCKRVYERKD